MAQGIMPAIEASNAATALWSIIGRSGFHPGNTDRVKNQAVGAEFDRRITEFVHKNLLRNHYPDDRPWRSLKSILRMGGPKKKPWSREEVVHNWYVNELTLIVACYFIFLGYYRLSKVGVLERLKELVVVWLLREFGYSLDSDHALFCPNQEWSRQMFWRVVTVSDEISFQNAPSVEEIERSVVSCEECPLRLNGFSV